MCYTIQFWIRRICILVFYAIGVIFTLAGIVTYFTEPEHIKDAYISICIGIPFLLISRWICVQWPLVDVLEQEYYVA